MQTNPKVTNIAINAAGGALVLIAGTKMASRVEVMEDPAYNGGALQGLTGYIMDPLSKGNPQRSNPNLQVWLPQGTGGEGWAFQPIRFGFGPHGAHQLSISADGTPLLQLTSAGAAGGVLLVEWD